MIHLEFQSNDKLRYPYIWAPKELFKRSSKACKKLSQIDDFKNCNNVTFLTKGTSGIAIAMSMCRSSIFKDKKVTIYSVDAKNSTHHPESVDITNFDKHSLVMVVDDCIASGSTMENIESHFGSRVIQFKVDVVLILSGMNGSFFIEKLFDPKYLISKK